MFYLSENMLVTSDWFPSLNVMKIIFSTSDENKFSVLLKVKTDVVVQQCDFVFFIVLGHRA